MPKTLLLADDSITIQRVVGITFANEDFEITTVDNGEDAVLRAKELKPDIVLADVIMPKRNGYEVCKAIKSDPELGNTPVLLLAGTFEAFDENRAREVGANGHITKPFESQALIDKVKEMLGGAPAAAPQPVAAPAAPRPVAPPAAVPRPIAPPTAPTPLRPIQPAPRPVAPPSMAASQPFGTTPPAAPRPITPSPYGAAAAPPPSAMPPIRPLTPIQTPSAAPMPRPIAPTPITPVASPFGAGAVPPAAPRPFEPKPIAPRPFEPKPIEPKPYAPRPPAVAPLGMPSPFDSEPGSPEPLSGPGVSPTFEQAPSFGAKGLEEPAFLTPSEEGARPLDATNFDAGEAPLSPPPAAAEEKPAPFGFGQPMTAAEPPPLELDSVASEPPEPPAVQASLAELAQEPGAPGPEEIGDLPSVDIDAEGMADQPTELAPMHEFIPKPEAIGHPIAAPKPPVRPAPEPARERLAPTAAPALSREELQAIARETIEKVAWEIVPQLAETILREEIEKLVQEKLV